MTRKRNDIPKDAAVVFLQGAIAFKGESCLIWPFFRNPYGYGTFGHEGRLHYAHRYICELVHGPAPTPEHQAAHDCGNGDGGCIHPRHVFWKTPLENSQDKIAHGTTYSKKGRPRQKLTQEQVDEIRQVTSVAEQFEIARRFGVSDSTVRKIIYGKSWSKPKRFTEFEADQIRRIRSLKGEAKARDLATEYQVSSRVIQHIWSGRYWSHIQ